MRVHVQPRAKREGAVGLHGESLKVALKAPPVEGEANEALLAWLAAELGIPRQGIVLVSGQSSRSKRLSLPLEAREKLKALIAKVSGT